MNYWGLDTCSRTEQGTTRTIFFLASTRRSLIVILLLFNNRIFSLSSELDRQMVKWYAHNVKIFIKYQQLL
jgi:hypothetical protein